MKHKVTLPDGRRMMEGWTEEKTTGRMFGCVNSADGVELLAPLSRNVFKNVLTLFKYRQSHKMFPSYSKTPSHILSFQSVLAHLEDVLTCLTCKRFQRMLHVLGGGGGAHGKCLHSGKLLLLSSGAAKINTTWKLLEGLSFNKCPCFKTFFSLSWNVCTF